MYFSRIIDTYLTEWANKSSRKPLLIRGARQIGKSTAIKHLGEQFECYIEVNFEKEPVYRTLFEKDLDVRRIIPLISAISSTSIIPGKTLLFFDEVQECPNAIMSLRYFCEDIPELHVIAAGSLLEFTLDNLPTFGVGRVHSMYMYPMTFDEYLVACGENFLIDSRNQATIDNSLDESLHIKLIDHLRTYILIGGMPESVSKWVDSHDYLQCQEVQDDILTGYEDDFPKYRKKVNPELLRHTMRSVASQATKKFIYSSVHGNYKAEEVRKALDLLIKAGLVIPVVHSNSNGLPLGDECDQSIRKMLFMDTGLMLRLLSMTMGDISGITTDILTASASELVNKGTISEMLAGLEYFHYLTPNIRHEMFYWVRKSKNSLAEIDYVFPIKSKVVPVEVKASRQGGMKSLWSFMGEKSLTTAIRCSLENFGRFDYIDRQSGGAIRHVAICPLYAMSQLDRIARDFLKE